jgi:hypothetical protein
VYNGIYASVIIWSSIVFYVSPCPSNSAVIDLRIAPRLTEALLLWYVDESQIIDQSFIFDTRNIYNAKVYLRIGNKGDRNYQCAEHKPGTYMRRKLYKSSCVVILKTVQCKSNLKKLNTSLKCFNTIFFMKNLCRGSRIFMWYAEADRRMDIKMMHGEKCFNRRCNACQCTFSCVIIIIAY